MGVIRAGFAVLRCSSGVAAAPGSAFSPKVEPQTIPAGGSGGSHWSGCGIAPGLVCCRWAGRVRLLMTWAANLHRWRLSSSLSPLSPLSGLSHPLALPGITSGCCRDRLRFPAAGWLRLLCSGAGDDLRAGALSALCSASAAGLACSAPLSSSAAPVALPAELYGLLPLCCRSALCYGVPVLPLVLCWGCSPAVSGCQGGRCAVRHIAQFPGLFFVYFSTYLSC